MRTLFILLILCAFAGCSKSNESDSTLPAAEATVVIPAGCTFQATSTHIFTRHGAEAADRYSCAFYPKMTCYFYKSASHAEIRCRETSSLDLYGRPAGCSYYAPGAHEFSGVAVLDVATYSCQPRSGLYCHYYVHDADLSYTDIEEMLCIDRVYN